MPEPEPEKPAADDEYADEGRPLGYELSDAEELAMHRSVQLYELGFSPSQVLRMGPHRPGFDWHRADNYLKAGKTHEQTTFYMED